MAFKNFISGETLTAADVNTYLAKQAVIVCTSGTRPGTPVEGMVIYETDTDKEWVYDGATWNLPKNRAGGALGYAQVVANQLSIVAVTDLTGLTVTVTVGSGRRIRVRGQASVRGSVTGDRVYGLIKEGATDLGRWCDFYEPAGTAESVAGGEVVLTPSAGAHTYKLTMERVAGTGTANLVAGTTNPAFILAEDIGV